MWFLIYYTKAKGCGFSSLLEVLAGGPLGLLDFVLRALRPGDPCKVYLFIFDLCDASIYDAGIHDACIHDTCIHDAQVHICGTQL